MIRDLHAAYLRGDLTPSEVTAAYLRKIGEMQGEWNAFLSVCASQAMETANAADARYASGKPLSLLDGIPVAIKDNFCTEGIPTTAASRVLEGYLPPYTATAVQALLAQGSVMLGKTNMDEFGFGSTGEQSAFGATVNPHGQHLVTGGSSSGSAAAVAGGLCAFALGSDTGGSVRLPAAFCGVYGLKPTWGRVSRFGLIAFSSSLDTVGVLAASADDCRTALRHLSVRDERDSTQLVPPRPSRPLPSHPTIGLLPALFAASEDAVAKRTLAYAGRLERGGARLIEHHLPPPEKALAAYYILSSAEAASNLARYDGIRFGTRGEGRTSEDAFRAARGRFGEEVKRRILRGNAALRQEGFREEYLAALNEIEAWKRALREALDECDLLLCPVCPRDAWEVGTPASYRDDLCTVPASITGLPALTQPISGGAVQWIGGAFDDELLLDAAEWGEELT